MEDRKVLTLQEERIIGHREEWSRCKRCPLHKLSNTRVLFDIYPKYAERLDVLVIGEGPGVFEMHKEMPFVGGSGKVIRRAVREAYISKLSYGLTNLVACRPVDLITGENRRPEEFELISCAPRLFDLVDIYNPKAVILLGLIARDNFGPMLKDHGYRGLIRNIHYPSYTLRNALPGTEAWMVYVDKFRVIFNEAIKRY